MSTTNGRAGMIEQPKSRRFVQGNGYTYTRTWRGPKSAAAGLEGQLIDAGYDVDVTEQGPIATVTAYVGANDSAGNETPIDRWELDVNEVEQSFFNHKNVSILANTEVGGEDLLTQLRRACEQDKSLTNVDPAVSEEDYPDFYTAYNLYFSGVESSVVYQEVVRFTRTVSNRVARTLSRTNVGKILTAAQMTSLEGAPSAIVYTETPPDVGYNVIFGYLKKKPRMTQLPGAKWQIIFEYEAGIWPTFLYESAS